MLKVGIGELKDHVSSYVKRAAAGEAIVILNRGREVAMLQPIAKKKPGSGRLLGYLKGSARIRGDVVLPVIPEQDWFRS